MTIGRTRKRRGTINDTRTNKKTARSASAASARTRSKTRSRSTPEIQPAVEIPIIEENNHRIAEEIQKIFGVYPVINEDNYTIRDPRDKKCITLQIDTVSKKIKIVIVNKCDLYNGKESIEKVIQLANNINYKNIYLEDFSHLPFTGKYWGVGIKLAPLSIMIRGKSWYNGHGFVSNNYENELSANSHLTSTKMGELLKNIYPHGVPSMPPSIIKELDYYDDQTLGEFMCNFLSYTQKIKKEDGTIPGTNVIIKWVNNIVILSNNFIVYDYNLHYDPMFDPYAKR